MPVMGPTYSQEEVDELTNETIQMLINKNAIESEPKGKYYITLRKKDTQLLRNAIEQFVMHSAWEWF